ncbi:ArdC family protein [Galenea microaerophila]
MAKATTREVFKQIVEEIVGLMEKDKLNWSKPFKEVFHQNPISGSVYRGVNPFLLSYSAHKNGFESPYWATFNQIKKAGAKIKRGAQSTPLFFYAKMEKEDKETGEVKTFPVFKMYRVFNFDQIEGDLKTPKDVKIKDFEKLGNKFYREDVETLVSNTGAKIKNAPDGASYSPSLDIIFLPDAKQFVNEYGYYATLLHELVHWSGHHSRLNREGITDLSATFGSKAYAFEELIAELGSVFLCSHLGLKKGGVDENHAVYLKSWTRMLKEEPMALWKAASKAQEAFDYLMSLDSD